MAGVYSAGREGQNVKRRCDIERFGRLRPSLNLGGREGRTRRAPRLACHVEEIADDSFPTPGRSREFDFEPFAQRNLRRVARPESAELSEHAAGPAGFHPLAEGVPHEHLAADEERGLHAARVFGGRSHRARETAGGALPVLRYVNEDDVTALE